MRSVKVLAVVLVGLLLGLGTPGQVRAEWVELDMYKVGGKHDFQLGTLKAPPGTSYVGVFVYDHSLEDSGIYHGFTYIGLNSYDDKIIYYNVNGYTFDDPDKIYYALLYDYEYPETYDNSINFNSIREMTQGFKYYGLYSEDINRFNNETISVIWESIGETSEYVEKYRDIFLFIAYLDSNKTLLDWEGLAHFGNPPPKAVVPVPGTVLLFGSGLLGLACLSRRLRRR